MIASGTRAVVVRGHGLAPLAELASALPADCGFAVIAMAPEQPNLVEALRGQAKLDVLTAENDRSLEPNRIYVIPGNRDVVIKRGRFEISPVAVPGVQLDRLARSLADELGRHGSIVVLEGPGTDGLLGIKRIKEAGGMVFAGPIPAGTLGELPRAASSAGMIDQIASVDVIAGQLVLDADEHVSPADDNDSQADALREILALVRIGSGHDFSAYKRATLYRRVARRLQVCQTASIADYHAYLREHPAELSHLLSDFLISVTNFFRDPEAYSALATEVLPRLFVERTDPIRVWVAGCATGEEAYSLGMLLLEAADHQPDLPKLQIFATDIDEAALTEARAGRYPHTIGVDVSPARLERFFVRDAEGYRVTPQLRELVLFSSHNVLRDPPFSRLDLVSCRNLLIYLNRDAQNRVLSIFHFGLKPDGFLFLGSSESAENTAIFATHDAKHRVFTRRMAPSTLGVEPIVNRWQPLRPPTAPHPVAPARITSIGGLHHRLAERLALPSILVDGDLDVVHVSEHAGRYLEVPPGESTRNVLRMVHPRLRLELRAGIFAARQTATQTDTRRVVFEDRGVRRVVELRVRGANTDALGTNAFLVFFDDIDGEIATVSSEGALIEPVVREIEDELHRTREQLRNTIEQYETSVEELKASNEELQAINEELRSASEELETSQEELQSVNEELSMLNHELKLKVDELGHANGDLQNLMSSTEIGVVFLDRNLDIKRFTPRATDVFNMIASDVGRPLAHITHQLDTTELPELARSVLQHLRTIERDVTAHNGHHYLMRLLPYRSLEDRIDGVVVTFVDVSDVREAVDARTRSEAALLTSETRLRASLRGAPVVVLSIDCKLQVTWGYALGAEVTPGPLVMVASHQRPAVQAAIDEICAGGPPKQLELELEVRGDTRTYQVRFEPAGNGEVTAVGFGIVSDA